MAKKTIKLDALKEAANKILRDSVNEYSVERSAIHYFISDILMQNNVYRGFRYLNASEMPPDHIPGIIPDYDNPSQHSFPDPSRTAFI